MYIFMLMAKVFRPEKFYENTERKHVRLRIENGMMVGFDIASFTHNATQSLERQRRGRLTP